MSAWEAVPAEAELADWTEAELEEYLRDVFDGLREHIANARAHDRDGWFAALAGDPECLALGHQPPEGGEWEEDQHHEYGWNDDLLAMAMARGTQSSAVPEKPAAARPPSSYTYTLRA